VVCWNTRRVPRGRSLALIVRAEGPAEAYTKVWADTIVQLIQAAISGLISLSALRPR
jgi:hypothetical protein